MRENSVERLADEGSQAFSTLAGLDQVKLGGMYDANRKPGSSVYYL